MEFRFGYHAGKAKILIACDAEKTGPIIFTQAGYLFWNSMLLTIAS